MARSQVVLDWDTVEQLLDGMEDFLTALRLALTEKPTTPSRRRTLRVVPRPEKEASVDA